MSKINSKRRSYKARALGMMGAAVLVGVGTIQSCRHGVSEFKRINFEQKQRYEQIQKRDLDFKNKRQQILDQHQRELDEYKKQKKDSLKEPVLKPKIKVGDVDVSKLCSNASKLSLIISKYSGVRARKYLMENNIQLSKNYRFLSASQQAQNKRILEPIARRIAKENGISEELFVKLIQHESKWDPFAINSGGDVGLCQLNKILWNGSVNKYHHNPLDPVQNMQASAKYLKELSLRFKSQDLLLTAYNWGPTRVNGLLKEGYSKNQIVSMNPNKYANKVINQKV